MIPIGERQDLVDYAAKVTRDRNELLAQCEEVKTWLELNNRRDSVLYKPVCAVIAKVKEVP